MKTSILEHLELDEETLSAARREAMRTNQPVDRVIAQWVVEKARAIKAAATKGGRQVRATAAA